MCDTVEDGKARKPAWEQFGLYKGRSNNVRLTQFSLPRQSYLVILDTISQLFCNEADYLRKRKQLKLPCLLVGHHFRYHQALLDHPNKNISGYSGIPNWGKVKIIMTKMKRSHISQLVKY